ncbi:MAG: FAD-dependent oxidoreductase [bacterium]
MTAKTKVAILGGGPAGLAAAFELSATPELRAKYAVTIYQSGWRVGGKCGQGRKGPANRIEINGTHYLFGAYDAAFRLASQVFEELEAKGDTRFGSYESQFIACSNVAIKEFFNGNWETWTIRVPGSGTPPGTKREGRAPLTLGATIAGVTDWMIGFASTTEASGMLTDEGATSTQEPHWWQRMGELIGRELGKLEHYVGVGALHLVKALATRLEADIQKSKSVRDAIVWLLTHFRSWAWSLLGNLSKTHIDARRLWQLIDIATTVMIGLIEDDVLSNGGYDRIDQYDFREWLTRWGAQEATVWSAPITTWYNAIAAYADGDIDRPDMSAGMGLRAILRLALTYEGAIAFQLSYEVGDSIIAPLYQVLSDRGVKFMYFHRVRDLVPSVDGRSIEAITVERQVTLKSGDPASYQPFMQLPNGRPVWPDEPLVDQIAPPVTGANDLLSFYAPSVGEQFDLKRGTDFDVAVYALPVATTRWYCAKLIDQKDAWRNMLNLGTTETQSLRLWLYPTMEEMGWPYGQAVLSGYYQPLATWENAVQLVAAETWPPDKTPGGIATLFGAFEGAPSVYPGPDEAGYPALRALSAMENATRFCRSYVGPLWPNGTHPSNPVGLDWEKLVALDEGVKGEELLSTQSIRVNIGPVEAYTQVHKGTLQYRLRADESGYGNLALAGDWIRNGYEIGSVEGAVLGGEQAAAAVKTLVSAR